MINGIDIAERGCGCGSSRILHTPIVNKIIITKSPRMITIDCIVKKSRKKKLLSKMTLQMHIIKIKFNLIHFYINLLKV